MTHPTCPTGLVRHGSRNAAHTEAQRRNGVVTLKRARNKAVHCPDCGGFHVVVVSIGTMRRRNPRQRARLDRSASYA